MSYEKDCTDMSPKMGACRSEVPIEPISEQVRCIEEMGNVANALASRIFVNLFGRTNEDACENAKGPECLEDVLKKRRRDMRELINKLEDVCSRLGV